MLNKCKEEDFYQIKSVSLGRLNVADLHAFFWAVFVFCAAMTGFSLFGISAGELEITTFLALMIPTSLIFLLLQFLFTIFFSIKKVAYYFQKFQSLLLSLFGLKLSIDMYQAFYVYSEAAVAPDYIKKIGLFFLIGGIVFLMLSSYRAIQRVKQGELRKEGKGLYNFKNSKGMVSVPIIFSFTILSGAAGKYFSEIWTDMTVLVILLIAVVLQYSIALALPEFFLLTYCKFRFESFKVKRPDSRMRGSKR